MAASLDRITRERVVSTVRQAMALAASEINSNWMREMNIDEFETISLPPDTDGPLMWRGKLLAAARIISPTTADRRIEVDGEPARRQVDAYLFATPNARVFALSAEQIIELDDGAGNPKRHAPRCWKRAAITLHPEALHRYVFGWCGDDIARMLINQAGLTDGLRRTPPPSGHGIGFMRTKHIDMPPALLPQGAEGLRRSAAVMDADDFEDMLREYQDACMRTAGRIDKKFELAAFELLKRRA